MVPYCSIKTAWSESQTLSNDAQEQVPFNFPLLSNSYKEQINPSHVSYEVKREKDNSTLIATAGEKGNVYVLRYLDCVH